MSFDEHSQKLSLESLDKAYQQGYMAGLTGHAKQPRNAELQADVLLAAWEAGWDDGNEQFELHKRFSA
ncbi:ribosome modulation factor [Ectopseudomonas mendocina]|uniref:Ribosome modulation factor n=1 Tax=Ectopseudomonas mendocina TaxID=300 RepID=A0ABZ2RHU3_ECTME